MNKDEEIRTYPDMKQKNLEMVDYLCVDYLCFSVWK